MSGFFVRWCPFFFCLRILSRMPVMGLNQLHFFLQVFFASFFCILSRAHFFLAVPSVKFASLAFFPGCRAWGLSTPFFFCKSRVPGVGAQSTSLFFASFLQVLPGILERMREGLINITFFCRFFLQVSHSFQDAGQDLQKKLVKKSDID